jgi:hypothetical protein
MYTSGSTPAHVQSWMRWGARVCWLAAVVVTVNVQPASATQESRERFKLNAVRVDESPVLDGVMNESVWLQARVIDAFVQQEPDEGAPASERTEVSVLYDGSNLYVGVRAFDSDPDGIVATEMRRDADRLLDEDNFQIIMDTFSDSRSAYMFVTTPLGAQLEQQVFEEGEGVNQGNASNINRNWDGVWHVSVSQSADGWTAEIAIPMVTVRFPQAAHQDWGINFMRNIRRKNEQVFWAPIPKAYGLTRVSLAGSLVDLQSLSRGLDLRIKPFVVGGGRRVSDAGDVDNSTNGDLGLDVKYGVTAGLNLDLTLNTDFAQAEADDEQVNLTRFPLFFPEKREFFLENAGQFNVGTTTASRRLADLFFSRRIGLSDNGEPVPIIGGARLTGRVGRNSVAVLDVQTDEAFGQAGENFLVARYSRDILGRSKVGAMVINKEVNLFRQVPDSADQFNRTAAVDLSLALNANLSITGFIARTSTPGVADGQMGGHARAGWLDPNWTIYTEYTDLQDNFNPEVGFVPRIGIRTSKAHIEPTPRPGRFGIRLLRPMVNITRTTDRNNKLLTRRYHYMVESRMDNGSSFVLIYNANFELLDQPFTVLRRAATEGGDVVIDAGQHHFGTFQARYSSDRSRQVFFNLGYSPQGFFDGNRNDLTSGLGVRLTNQISAEGLYSRNSVDLPGGDFVAQVGSFRVDYAVSPTMSLRTLTQYNSLSELWSTSARFRFTYRPGSDLFVVYDELRRDLSGLTEFRDRRVILKFTYLMSR